MHRSPSKTLRTASRQAFTMVEMLVATAVFILLVTLLLSLVSHATQVWQRTDGQKNRQQAGRHALEMISRDLESAIFPLSTNSTLHFQLNPGVAGFENPAAAFWQSASSTETNGSDINDVGYFVAWTTDRHPVAELRRYQLAATNAESSFQIGSNAISSSKLKTHAPGSDDATTHQGLVARNIIGLWITLFEGSNAIVSPYDSLTSALRPTSAEVAVAVMDPRSAGRLSNAISSYTTNAEDFAAALNRQYGNSVQIYQTRVLIPCAQQ